MKEASEKQIQESKDYPVGVFHSSPYNSTPFTKCCDSACISEACCPSCGKYVVGYDLPQGQRYDFRFNYAYKKDNNENGERACRLFDPTKEITNGFSLTAPQRNWG